MEHVFPQFAELQGWYRGSEPANLRKGERDKAGRECETETKEKWCGSIKK